MAKLQKFDRKNLKEFRTELDAALARVEKKFGISISSGNISFDEFECTVKLTSKIQSKAANAKESKLQSANYLRVGLSEDIIGKTIHLSGYVFTAVRIDTKKWKNPIIAETPDGKSYKLSVRQWESGTPQKVK